MPGQQWDLANNYTWGRSIGPISLAASANGTGIDLRDCGPEVTCIEAIGTNPGDDTSLTTKLQESADDSTYTDVSGATFTAVTGDTENQVVVRTFFNRAKRYVRAVCTITGTSPVVLYCAIVGAPKTSY